MKITYIKT